MCGLHRVACMDWILQGVDSLGDWPVGHSVWAQPGMCGHEGNWVVDSARLISRFLLPLMPLVLAAWVGKMAWRCSGGKTGPEPGVPR